MIIIGENSYVDIPYADRYVETYNTAYAPLAVHWSVLTDKEKEQYLYSSLSQIEKLPFIGRKYAVNQKLQFPRYLRVSGYGCMHYPFNTVQEEDIPEDVKEAQVENALGLINAEINAISDRQFMTMQSLGAVKNTKYNKREAGDLGFGDDLKGSGSSRVQITSAKAYQLLRPWVGGGFKC